MVGCRVLCISGGVLYPRSPGTKTYDCRPMEVSFVLGVSGQAWPGSNVIFVQNILPSCQNAASWHTRILLDSEQPSGVDGSLKGPERGPLWGRPRDSEPLQPQSRGDVPRHWRPRPWFLAYRLAGPMSLNARRHIFTCFIQPQHQNLEEPRSKTPTTPRPLPSNVSIITTTTTPPFQKQKKRKHENETRPKWSS